MLTLMLVGALEAAAAQPPACAPAPSAATQTLRGHRYRQIGACGDVAVWRTATTDSTFRDRAAAVGPVILVTDESVDPTAKSDWPAPPGNLYLSLVVPLAEEAARAHLVAALDAWRAEVAPGLSWTVGWDGPFGAHRGPAGRLLTGLALEPGPGGEGTAVGLDVHLAATEEDYAARGAAGQHATLASLTGAAPPRDAALWAVLERLWVPSPPTSR